MSTTTVPSGAESRLIACDVFEHAYYHKDGPKRAVYIDNFLANLHWGRINERFKKLREVAERIRHRSSNEEPFETGRFLILRLMFCVIFSIMVEHKRAIQCPKNCCHCSALQVVLFPEFDSSIAHL